MRFDEIGAALAFDHVELQIRGATRGLLPRHRIECDLSLGQIGAEAHGGLAAARARRRDIDRNFPLHDLAEIEAQLIAIGVVEYRRDAQRRLAVVFGIVDVLPADFREHAGDQHLALGVDRLLGEVEIDGRALHVVSAEQLAAARVEDPRLALDLDVVRVDLRGQRQPQLDLAFDLALDAIERVPRLLQDRQWLLIEHRQHRLQRTLHLERDLSVRHLGIEIGDREPASLQRNAAARSDHDRGIGQADLE